MNYHEDSSSDDVPYLPAQQFQDYERQRNQFQNEIGNNPGEISSEQRRAGRSSFTEEELRELDAPPVVSFTPTISTVPRPPSQPDILTSTNIGTTTQFSDPRIAGNPSMDFVDLYSLPPEDQEPPSSGISWGRRLIGILLVGIPAVLFSVAAHFVDWSMSDFQLFSAGFFSFQGIFWPSFGILLADIFCVSKRSTTRATKSISSKDSKHPIAQAQIHTDKWLLAALICAHGILFAVGMILQILSIQRLNITISLALSFGFDVIVLLISYISEKRKCSFELLLLSLMSYCGYAVVAIPAINSEDKNVRYDTMVGVGASVGVMLLGVPATLILAHLRKNHVSDSIIGTSFGFFGCIASLITKEIMGSTLSLKLDGRAIGWAAGLIAVVFLGTIFLFLESRLSSLIWRRDDDRPREFSSITRTRVAVFLLSCLWEISRQGFTDNEPVIYDIFGGLLIIVSFLLGGGFNAWSKDNDTLMTSGSESASRPCFCAFIPWLFLRKSQRTKS